MIADALRQHIQNIEPSDTAPDNSQQITVLRAQLETLKQKQDSLWEKYAEGMPRDTFDRLLAKNADAIQHAESALQSAESLKLESERRKALAVSLHDALDSITSPDVPPAAVNALLKSCISRIHYRRSPAEKSGGNRGGWKSYEPELTIELKI